MYTKKIRAVLLAAALAATMFAGCGKGSDDSAKDTKPQESQDVAATENIEETENGAETESQEPQPQYPEIVSDGKVKSYQSVVTVDDAAYEAFALGGRCEGCGVGGLFGGAGCGASDLGQGFLGRGEGVHVLLGLLPYGGICYQQHTGRQNGSVSLFHESFG